MFSILIPTHDYNCFQLVADLHEQADKLGAPYEIIVAEDGSRDQVTVIANHKIVGLSNCTHLVRKENVGQAALRNELAKIARYDWIIFIDSDAKVENEDFLHNYLKNIEKVDVIVGGLKTPVVNHDPHRTLRHKYERNADKKRGADIRMQNPYMQLSCFNIMMRRSMFLSILFDNECCQYGYEDALFGVELDKRGISILHIDNPLIHKGLDTNEAFLRKTETALRTLKSLRGKMDGHCHLENVMNKLQRMHLSWAMCLFHHVCRGLLRKNLLSRNPSLFLFSIYKLGYYACLKG